MTLSERPKPLSSDCSLHCFLCKSNLATHLCRFSRDWGQVQACLCPSCMTLDIEQLARGVLSNGEEGMPFLNLTGQIGDVK